MIRVVVPGVPVGKGRHRMTRSGHCYTPAKTADYEEKIALFGFKGMAGRRPLEGPVKMEIEAIFEIPKSWTKKKKETAEYHISVPDGDNILKAISDGLNGIAYLDDAQIADVRIVKRYGDRPGVSVRIDPLIEEKGETNGST